MTREQFTAYVESSQKALRRFLTALCCGDSALADDIAQETYIKAYLASDTFRDPSKFSSWIHRIAYNTFVSYHRSEKTALCLDEARSVAADEQCDAAFRYQALYAALERLSDKERTAILLYYLEDYSVKEICDIIEASPETVRQQLSRGRNHLKKMLCTTMI